MLLLIILFSLLTYNAFAGPNIQKIDDSTAGELVTVPIKTYIDQLKKDNDQIADANANMQGLTAHRDAIQTKIDAAAAAGIADAVKVNSLNAIGP